MKFNTKNVIQVPSTTFFLSLCRCLYSCCVKLLTLFAQKSHEIKFINGLKETVTTLDLFFFLVCPQGLSPVKYLCLFIFFFIFSFPHWSRLLCPCWLCNMAQLQPEACIHPSLYSGWRGRICRYGSKKTWNSTF